MNFIKKISPVDILSLLIFAAIAAFIILISSYKISNDDDFFWHLATGRYIVNTMSVPSQDVFSISSGSAKWVPFEWGWDVTTYAIYNAGGFVLLSIFRTLLILGIFYFLFLSVRTMKVKLAPFCLFTVLFIFGIFVRFSIRPHLISYLFISILIYTLIRYKDDNKSGKMFFFLPLMFLIWCNMHMGVILGISYFSLFVLYEFYDYKKQKKSDIRRIKTLVLVFLGSLAAMLINPGFIDTYIYALNHSNMAMLEMINEWKSPFAVQTTINIKIYFVILFSGILIFYYSYSVKDYFPSLIFAVFAVYSTRSVRFITDFLIIVFPFYTAAIVYLFSKFVKPERFQKNSVFTKLIVILLLIYLDYSILNNNIYSNFLDTSFRETGFGINEKNYPSGAMDFLRKENIPNMSGKVFNNLSTGGYFIWSFPGKMNYIDSRNLSDSIYFNYKSIDEKQPGFENKLSSEGIEYVIYSNPYLSKNAAVIKKNLISYLCTNPDKWKLVYWDDKSFVFVKNTDKFHDIIKANEYKYISSYNLIFNADIIKSGMTSDKETLYNEYKRKLSEEPEGKFTNELKRMLK
ncbi:MAG: hypothetical protein PHN88_08950 [Ignavibacteria bacterium]|nr:hypothetical protein [Ignavibacteria bacterium]